nr:methylated-DNA--[protein]-cysteine S-methyltransferase [Paenibacillus agaridevorans]
MNGERQKFTFEIDLIGTAFQCSVWHALTEIRYGELQSYGKIAERIGNPRAVRAVGAANERNPLPIVVPCHRVIGKSKDLTGYRGGLKVKSGYWISNE